MTDADGRHGHPTTRDGDVGARRDGGMADIALALARGASAATDLPRNGSAHADEAAMDVVIVTPTNAADLVYGWRENARMPGHGRTTFLVVDEGQPAADTREPIGRIDAALRLDGDDEAAQDFLRAMGPGHTGFLQIETIHDSPLTLSPERVLGLVGMIRPIRDARPGDLPKQHKAEWRRSMKGGGKSRKL